MCVYLLKLTCPRWSCRTCLYPGICSIPKLSLCSHLAHSLPSCLRHVIQEPPLILLSVSPLTSNPWTSPINSVSKIYLWLSLQPCFTPGHSDNVRKGSLLPFLRLCCPFFKHTQNKSFRHVNQIMLLPCIKPSKGSSCFSNKTQTPISPVSSGVWVPLQLDLTDTIPQSD